MLFSKNRYASDLFQKSYNLCLFVLSIAQILRRLVVAESIYLLPRCVHVS